MAPRKPGQPHKGWKDSAKKSLATNPAYLLVDRHCAMLDGHCNCLKEPGKNFPNCEKYQEVANAPR